MQFGEADDLKGELCLDNLKGFYGSVSNNDNCSNRWRKFSGSLLFVGGAEQFLDSSVFIGGDFLNVSVGSLDVAQDYPSPPSGIEFVVDHDVEGVFPFIIGFDLVEAGGSPSGGDVYEAKFDFVVGVPILDPDPVDPLDPLDPLPPSLAGPLPPPPPPPPPDPDFPFDYNLFRQAVEIALANRDLSGKQIQDAVQNALDNQGLDSGEIRKAMQLALQNQGLSQKENTDAVETALKRQGLSAKNIGAAVADNLSSSMYQGVGDDGSTVTGSVEGVADGISTNTGVTGASGTISSMGDAMQSFIDGIPKPSMPEGISQISSVNLTLGGATVVLDWGSYAIFQEFRTALSWMVHFLFWVGVVSIIRKGVA